MGDECRRTGRWRGRPTQLARDGRNYVCNQRRRSVDRDRRRRLLSRLVDQPHAFECAESPLVTAAVCENYRVRGCAGLGAGGDFFARVAAEEPRARHRRSGDHSYERKQRGATPQHDQLV